MKDVLRTFPSLSASSRYVCESPRLENAAVRSPVENLFCFERWISSKNLMTTYSSGGVYNPAYHDSETLEVDRRFVATGT